LPVCGALIDMRDLAQVLAHVTIRKWRLGKATSRRVSRRSSKKKTAQRETPRPS